MTSAISALGLNDAGSLMNAMSTASPYASTSSTDASSSSTSSTSSSSSSSSDQSLLDPQAFLQLLVAQLQYQDPTDPVDTSSFMNQTAMLSQVQTMNSMSDTLSALADAQQAQSATGMIGKQVSYTNSAGLTVSGVVTSTTLASSGATLTLADGTTVALSDVTQVSDPTSTTTSST